MQINRNTKHVHFLFMFDLFFLNTKTCFVSNLNTTWRYTTCTNYLEMMIDVQETMHVSTDFM